MLEPAIRALPARQRVILLLRFQQDMTQSEIAQVMGISQMHVSRLLRQALARLREVARARHARRTTPPRLDRVRTVGLRAYDGRRWAPLTRPLG